MSPWKLGYYLVRCFGPRILWLRAGVYARKRIGHDRRIYRSRPWNSIQLGDICRPGTPHSADAYAAWKESQPPQFLFPLGHPPAIDPTRIGTGSRLPDLGDRWDLLQKDRCVYFCDYPSPSPIDWHGNPFDGTAWDRTRSWCELSDYRPEQGDARWIWEPARAGWAIDCAKLIARGVEPINVAQTFWRWVDSFMQGASPFLGTHWKCGQESAVRLLAIVLGFWSLPREARSPQRWQQFARLAWATGYRIHHHIAYAISQKNNHAISEASGLMLIGHLFPELREAAAWQRQGRRILLQEMARQVYADGSYVQHSHNYQRVMMQGATFAGRLAELGGDPFPSDFYERLASCAEFIHAMLEPTNGQVPQYGANDGAYILPLNECLFWDFRPTVQSAYFLARRRHCLPAGPWDEDGLWLYGAEYTRTTKTGDCAPPQSRPFTAGGYYTLRANESWSVIRCHTYRDRPAQCDHLHWDLWWKGINIARDSGTYRYYVPGQPEWEYYFKSVRAHNTVQIGDDNPLELVSRFLWFPWPRGHKRHFVSTPDSRWLEMEHHDYRRRPWHATHRRTVVHCGSDTWLVIDDLFLGRPQESISVRWHLADLPWQANDQPLAVALDTPHGLYSVRLACRDAEETYFRVVRGEDKPGDILGWASPSYGKRVPIPTLEARFQVQGQARVLSLFAPGEIRTMQWERVAKTPEEKTERWFIETDSHRFRLTLHPLAIECPGTLLGCQAEPLSGCR